MSVHPYVERLKAADLIGRTGRVNRILPTSIEADGPNLPLGALCAVEGFSASGAPSEALLAEVVGVARDAIVLTPLKGGLQTFLGAQVVACPEAGAAPVGDGFAGRAVNAFGEPIDGGPPIRADRFGLLQPPPQPPLERATPNQVLETGLGVVDCLLTLGHGQRVGVFAASGVGKTNLLFQLARQVDADHCVVCLIGERGREVETFWSEGLSDTTKRRTTLVSSVADEPAAARIRAANYALALAEYWRAKGRHVLLLLDSATRLAMAMREIGLAAGEPPTLRAYPPSIFSAMPKLVERCGAWRSGGAITAVMTVLSETDDLDDPICELMKSLLDGHILLSRVLAGQGHYPAIDAPRSVSRLASAIRTPEHQAIADEALKMLSLYEQSRTLVESGLYMRGTNPDLDKALHHRPALVGVLKQGAQKSETRSDSLAALSKALGQGV